MIVAKPTTNQALKICKYSLYGFALYNQQIVVFNRNKASLELRNQPIGTFCTFFEGNYRITSMIKSKSNIIYLLTNF